MKRLAFVLTLLLSKCAVAPVAFAQIIPTAQGELPIAWGQAPATTVSWTSATADETTQAVAVTGYSTVLYSHRESGTISGGVIFVEGSNDGGANYFSLPGLLIDSATTPGYASTVNLTSSNVDLRIAVGGLTHFRIRLETAITGAGTAVETIIPSVAPYPGLVATYTPQLPDELSAGSLAVDLASLGGVTLSGVMPIAAGGASIIACSSSAAISVSSSGNNEIVALSNGQTIYVCSFSLVVRGTVAVQWVYGTGSACGTSETDITGPYSFQAREGIVQGSGLGTVFRTAASNALCLELSDAIQVDGVISYSKF
jgi:hypothetical protein